MKKTIATFAFLTMALAATANDHYWIGPVTGGRWSDKTNWLRKDNNKHEVPDRSLDSCYFTNDVTVITDYSSTMSMLYFQNGATVTFKGDETLGTSVGVTATSWGFGGGATLILDEGAYLKRTSSYVPASLRLILTNSCRLVGSGYSHSWPDNSYVEINGGANYQNFRIDGSGTNCTFRFRNGANVTSSATFGNMGTNTTILAEGGSSFTHGGCYGDGYGPWGGAIIARDGSTINITGQLNLNRTGGNLLSAERGSSITISGKYLLTGHGTVISNENSSITVSKQIKMAWADKNGAVAAGEQFIFVGEDAQMVVGGSVVFNDSSAASAGATFAFCVPEKGFVNAPFRNTDATTKTFGNPKNIKPNGVNSKFVHVKLLASSPALDPSYAYATLSKLLFTAGGLQNTAFLDCTVEGAGNQATFALTTADGVTETATAANVRFVTARMENGAGGKPLATRAITESKGVADYSTLSVSRRTYTFTSAVTQLADAPLETFAVLYAGESSSSLVPVATNAIASAGNFSFTWTGSEFRKTYYLRVALETRTAGDDVTHVEWSATRSAATKDTTSYTWKDVDGDWTGDWGDNRHWSDNQNGDCIGHPATTDANVTIPGGHDIVINLDAAYTIGYFYANSADTRLTLKAPSGSRDSNALVVKGNSYGNWSSFGGANDAIVLDGCNVDFWYTVFQLGNHSSLVLTNAAYAKLRQVKVSHSGAVGTWFRVLEGSYVTMPVGPGVVLGYSTGNDPCGMVIDNSTVSSSSQLQLHSAANAVSCGSITFRGTNPVLSVTSGSNKSFFSSATDANEHRFIFEVPDGGFAAPPVQCTATSGNPAFSLDSATAQLNVVFEIADDSAAYGVKKKKDSDLPLMTAPCGINKDCVSFVAPKHAGRGNTFLYGTATASPFGWTPVADFTGTAKSIGLRVMPPPCTVIMLR